MPAKSEIAAAARALLRRAFKGTLASLDTRNDYPYASLITVATDAAGAPTFLISKLARHTANLGRNRRASILVDETGALAEVAARLFSGLRALDAAGVDVIVTRDLGRGGLGLAIWDRLYRAAEGRVLDSAKG